MYRYSTLNYSGLCLYYKLYSSCQCIVNKSTRSVRWVRCTLSLAWVSWKHLSLIDFRLFTCICWYCWQRGWKREGERGGKRDKNNKQNFYSQSWRQHLFKYFTSFIFIMIKWSQYLYSVYFCSHVATCLRVFWPTLLRPEMFCQRWHWHKYGNLMIRKGKIFN